MNVKIKFSVLTLGILLIGSALSFYAHVQNEESKSFIILRNVNALANEEAEGGSGTIYCYCSFVNKGHGYLTVMDCRTCFDVDCEACTDRSTCR